MFKRILKIFIAAINIIALAVIFVSSPVIQAEASAENALHGKIVILDAGHGLGSSNIYAGYDEQVTMLKLANKIKRNLESYGITVYMTRPAQYNVHLSVRAAAINIWALQEVKKVRPNDAGEIDRLIKIMQNIIDDYEKYAPVYMNYPFDYAFKRKIHTDLQKVFEYQDHPVIRDKFLVISLHSDATAQPIDTSINGATAFHISNNFKYNPRGSYYGNYSNEDRSRKFGNKLLDNIDKLGIRKREVRHSALFILREHNLPAVLIENGFHTNDHDRDKLSDDAFLDRLALVYADTISAYFTEISPLPEYQMLETPEQQHIATPFSIYRRPSFASEKITTYSPQTVIIRARTADGWALISTSHGRYWVYIGN